MSDAEQVFHAYRNGWRNKHGLPCSLILSALDYGKLGIHLQEGLTVTQLREALTAYFETDDPFVIKRRHPLGLFLAQPMRYLPQHRGRPRYITPCPHAHPCENTRACCWKQDIEARRF